MDGAGAANDEDAAEPAPKPQVNTSVNPDDEWPEDDVQPKKGKAGKKAKGGKKGAAADDDDESWYTAPPKAEEEQKPAAAPAAPAKEAAAADEQDDEAEDDGPKVSSQAFLLRSLADSLDPHQGSEGEVEKRAGEGEPELRQ